jgi:ribosomal protein S18 acetylase RimI-like enzyme
MNKRNILEHHIYFLSTHRGQRESLEQTELIHSNKSYFNIAFTFSTEAVETVSPMFNLYLPDWINIDDKLKNWKSSGAITYMTLNDTNQIWNLNTNLQVRKASSMQEIEDFSLVQGKGFCDPGEDFNEWYPWMREMNIKNFKNSDQNFYIAYEKEKPLAVALSIIHNGIAGLYAVATLPEYRNQGISTSIMKSVTNDCIKNNIHVITLQVNTNSYAHHFYKKLGFINAFECKIFSYQ